MGRGQRRRLPGFREPLTLPPRSSSSVGALEARARRERRRLCHRHYSRTRVRAHASERRSKASRRPRRQPLSVGYEAGIVDKAIALLPQLEAGAEARKESVFLPRFARHSRRRTCRRGVGVFFVSDPSKIFARWRQSGGAARTRWGRPRRPWRQKWRRGRVAGRDWRRAGRGSENRELHHVLPDEGARGDRWPCWLKRRVATPPTHEARFANPSHRHSFGGRVVTAAAHALDDNTAAVRSVLLQATRTTGSDRSSMVQTMDFSVACQRRYATPTARSFFVWVMRIGPDACFFATEPVAAFSSRLVGVRSRPEGRGESDYRRKLGPQ
jgi:hypothetical protein